MRWLQRQLNDPYVAEAQRKGYRSRAAFKLIQLDERFGLLKPGLRVIDLGAAPGGWSQIVAERVGKSGRAVALDISEMVPLPAFATVRYQSGPVMVMRYNMYQSAAVHADAGPGTSSGQAIDRLKAAADDAAGAAQGAP